MCILLSSDGEALKKVFWKGILFLEEGGTF